MQRSARRITALFGGRATILATLIVAQALCSAFFLGDVIEDFRLSPGPIGPQSWFEAAAAGVLTIGVVVMALELSRLLARQAAQEDGLRAARGAMAELIDAFFERWSLTPAEAEVALFALKGLSNDEIAALRGSAVGTVRAQTARIYAKAGVSGRAQLMSVFVEERLAAPLASPAATAPHVKPLAAPQVGAA
jgi:DNA-binding CsgD family transcriptional regulator